MLTQACQIRSALLLISLKSQLSAGINDQAPNNKTSVKFVDQSIQSRKYPG